LYKTRCFIHSQYVSQVHFRSRTSTLEGTTASTWVTVHATEDYSIKYERNSKIKYGIDAQGYSRENLPMTKSDAYVDASFAGDVDTHRSTTGYVFKISGGPVSWQSHMQTCGTI
jgi:spore germination protein YaaH